MTRYFLYWCGIALSLLAGSAAAAVEVHIDTSAAHAVLQALHDPRLTRARALEIARMRGNQGPVRQLQEFGTATGADDLANALYAAAHGEPVTRPAERAYQFDRLLPKLAQAEALLAQIERSPAAFQAPIQKRLALYSPPDLDLKIDGYVVAAGDGAGYAFGGTDFYLDLIMLDDLAHARSVTTHEMYHTIQGGLAGRRAHATAPACASADRLFDALYREGTAVEVADVSLLQSFTGPVSANQRRDMEDGMKHLGWHATLLDMSIASFQGVHPLPYDDVYAVGFLGHGALYNVGYAMASAIAKADGPAGLARFLTRPPAQFVRAYTALPAYGRDGAHPALGPNALAALDRLEHGCP